MLLHHYLITIHFLLAVVVFPQQVAFAKVGNVESKRKLQTTKCAVPFTWKKPTWWNKYRKILTAQKLKRCVSFKGKAPVSGKRTCTANQLGFVCLFGEARCDGKTEPETKCECTNDLVWTCSTVCDQPKCPFAVPSGTCNPLVHINNCDYGEYCCGDSCISTTFCSCETYNGESNWECAVAGMMPCDKTSLEEAGCPCDRPVNGDTCTDDYGCGDACCGADAYTCKCNSAGIYESCGKTGFVPGPNVPCSCIDTEKEPSIVDLMPSTPTRASDIPGCPATGYPVTGDSCTDNFGCGAACCGSNAYECKCGANKIQTCTMNTPLSPFMQCLCVGPSLMRTRTCPAELPDLTINEVFCVGTALSCPYPSGLTCTCAVNGKMTCHAPTATATAVDLVTECGVSQPDSVMTTPCQPGLDCIWEKIANWQKITASCTCSADSKFGCQLSITDSGASLLNIRTCPTVLPDMVLNEVMCHDGALTCSYPGLSCSCEDKKQMTCSVDDSVLVVDAPYVN
jgi:hypothetical protein